MAAEVYPALADHLIGLVDVVQALKLKIQLRQSPSVVRVPDYKPICSHV